VSGWGTAATPPAFASTGHEVETGRSDVHQELFVVTRGINDRQLWGLNMSRFMSVDLLTNVHNIQFDTAQFADSIPPQDIPNIFDFLQVFLYTPWSYTQPFTHPCGNQHITVIVDTHIVGGQTFEQCSPGVDNTIHIPGPSMRLSGRNDGWGANSSFLWGEFGHMFSWTSLASDAEWRPTFSGSMLTPRTCNTDADCGGAHCDLGKVAGADSFTETKDWVNRKVCMVAEPDFGYRLMGFVISRAGNGFYDITSDQHNYLYFAEAYRWHADTLREEMQRDSQYGDSRLKQKYAFLKRTYGGVEFNGAIGNSDDESLGGYAMPDR
jgi:hypothetical protein